MSQQLSKVVSNRQKAAELAIGAVKTYGPATAPAVDKLLFKDQPPTFKSIDLFTACGEALNSITGEYVAADRKAALELQEDRGARVDHNDGIAEFRDLIIGMKNGLDAMYYDGKAAEYALPSDTPYDPKLLVSVAANIIKRLEEKPDLGTPRSGFAAPDAQLFLDQIAEKKKLMEQASQSVVKETGEYKLAVRNRDMKGDEWEKVYSNIAGILSNLFSIAGRNDLAELVRPTSRKKSGTIEPDAQIPLEEPAAPNTTISMSNTTTPTQS